MRAAVVAVLSLVLILPGCAPRLTYLDHEPPLIEVDELGNPVAEPGPLDAAGYPVSEPMLIDERN